MSRPILYSFRRCPYAIRARMALYFADVECELREVVLKNKPEEMLHISSKGTVPVLLVDGKVIDESLDVMRWALNRQTGADSWRVGQLDHPLVQRNDGYFKYWLDRYKYFERYPEQSQAFYLEKAVVFLQELEQSLVPNDARESFIETPALSSADVAIFPFVRQFAFADKLAFDQLNLPKLAAWLEWQLQSPLFLAVMNKYPAWSPAQTEPVLFSQQ